MGVKDGKSNAQKLGGVKDANILGLSDGPTEVWSFHVFFLHLTQAVLQSFLVPNLLSEPSFDKPSSRNIPLVRFQSTINSGIQTRKKTINFSF